VGDLAPDFTLEDFQGNSYTLSQYRGESPVIIYFYPKANTSGCTTQACDLRDNMNSITRDGVNVLGVSPDSITSHIRFRDKFGLNFPLLADEDHAVAEAYGVWKEKSMYGKNYWGIERSTFIIDPDGVVLHAWRKVRPKGHAQRVIDALTV
jgi:peroxiredoxin Q/BCP